MRASKFDDWKANLTVFKLEAYFADNRTGTCTVDDPLTLNLMSSSRNLQPEDTNNVEDAEDVSIPTLSSYFTKFKAKISKLINNIFRPLSSSRRAPKAPSSTVQENLSN